MVRDLSKKASKKRVKATTSKKKKKEVTLGNMLEAEGEIDFAKLVKTEYLKLQRVYRLMEDTRHRVTGAGNALSKQARMVELLRAEGEDLETGLYNATSPSWKAIDRQTVTTILSILEQLEKGLTAIAYCLKNIHEMASHVDRITKHVIDHQLKVQSIYGRSLTVPQVERRKRNLENRLYLETTRFDTKIWSNKGLRDEINMMLKLRGLFFQRHLAMKRQLAVIRNKMTEVVFTATQAYEQRDELVASINNIREKNDKDTRQHVLEIREFYRVLKHDACVREFNTLKNRERLLLESQTQRDRRRLLNKRDDMDSILNSYQKSFQQILASSNQTTLESFLKLYEEIQQENFALFVCISNVNEETLFLRQESHKMCAEIEESFELWKEREAFEAKTLADSAMAIEEKQSELAQLSRMFEINKQQMDETLEVLDAVFVTARCSPDLLNRLLGPDKGVRRALLTMQAVEMGGRDLLLEKQGLEVRRNVELEGVALARATAGKQAAPRKDGVGGGPYFPDVIVAGRVEGEDEQEDEDRGAHILNASEYRQKITERLLLKPDMDQRDSRGALSSSDRPSNNSSTGSMVKPAP